VRQRQDSLLAQLEHSLGGREQLAATFQLVSREDPAYPIARVLADPETFEISLGKLCRRLKIKPYQLLATYNATLERITQARVATIAAQKVAPVAEDLMTRAAPHYALCGECHGSGTTFVDPANPADAKTVEVACRPCRGTGQVYVLPDLARQKAALDLARVTPVAGPNVAIHNDHRKQIGAVVLPSADSFTRIQYAVDRILREPRPAAGGMEAPAEEVVDAEVAPEVPVAPVIAPPDPTP
jgi:hypothetical protein